MKQKKPLSPAQIERNRGAGLARSRKRTREEYQEMARKRWAGRRKDEPK